MPPLGSDVANIPVSNATPTYCTASDVAAILEVQPPSEHAEEGERTLTQWNNQIIRTEGYIDRTTGTSWRPRRVKLEYHDYTTWHTEEYYIRIQLQHSPVKTLASGQSDALEVWDGSQWEDWLANKTEGRDNDYWLEEPSGFLYLRRSLHIFVPEARVKLSYRYGSSDVPDDIAEACALLAAVRLSQRGTRHEHGHGGEVDKVSMADSVQQWRADALSILANHQAVGGGY